MEKNFVRSIIFKIVLVVFTGVNCAAKTLYVDVNGPNDPGTGSYEDPFLRIQDAVDSADSNDTVIVAQGHYCENIGIDGNNIVLTSTDPNNPEVVSKTIIDGNDAGPVITFTGLAGPKAVLSGLTITNGYANYGGGIYCFNNSSPEITNCTITGNGAGGYSGGIPPFEITLTHLTQNDHIRLNRTQPKQLISTRSPELCTMFTIDG